jgi:hypothetical protein
LICGVVDTGDNFFTCVTIIAGDNSTGDYFIASINDTGEQLSTVMTPAITVFPGVIDTGHK